MNIWEQFDNAIDVEGLKKDAEEAAKNGGTFEEVPEGVYEVEIDKLELKQSKKGAPMVSAWMKIAAGQRKGSLIFYNQVISTGYGLHNANEFLKSLDSGVDVKFENFKQYNDMLLDVFEEVNGSLSYQLNYGKNAKGFNTYKIEDVFEN